MSAKPGELPVLPTTLPPAPADPRALAAVRARLLAWVGLGWHAVEAAVALGAGVIAGSIALVGFGADSLIELLAGVIVLWRLSSRLNERRAQQLIAVSFYALSVYVAYEAIYTLAAGRHPQVSWVGIGLSVVTLATMPPLAIAKQRVAVTFGSPAVGSESRQTMLCAYLSAGLLVGLAVNAALGWWWADPLAALGIGAVAAKEGRDAWRGRSCCTASLAGVEHHCSRD